jgi:hypothetical protein
MFGGGEDKGLEEARGFRMCVQTPGAYSRHLDSKFYTLRSRGGVA